MPTLKLPLYWSITDSLFIDWGVGYSYWSNFIQGYEFESYMGPLGVHQKILHEHKKYEKKKKDKLCIPSFNAVKQLLSVP